MINPRKTGKFITELRKDKELTQERLGDIIGISSKSISKWERGLSFPDSSHLCELSKILGVSVIEILNGEKLIDEGNNIKTNTLTVDGNNLYKNKSKHKCVMILLTFIISFAFLILLLFMFNNYNNCKIYSINSLDENVELNGYIIFYPYKNIILINNILYTGNYGGINKETLIKSARVSLISNGKNIYSKSNDAIGEEPISISEYLNNCEIYLSEEINEDVEPIKFNRPDNLYLLIEYCDQRNDCSSINVEIEIIEEFKNNKLIY